MCCTGRTWFTCCRLHLVALLCLMLVAILITGHFLVDVAGLSATSLPGLHLHGGFPLPAATTLATFLMLIFPIAIRSIHLTGWTEPPMTPPPLPSP